MIVYCCTDLIFATKIRSTAESLDIITRPARDAQALQNRLDQVDDGKPNDAVTGVLVDLELGPAAMELIRQAKTQSGDNPPAIVAFGSHVQTASMEDAQTAGADFVMPRSSFTVNLVSILERLNQA